MEFRVRVRVLITGFTRLFEAPGRGRYGSSRVLGLFEFRLWFGVHMEPCDPE